MLHDSIFYLLIAVDRFGIQLIDYSLLAIAHVDVISVALVLKGSLPELVVYHGGIDQETQE
jgi:hypothetical protein